MIVTDLELYLADVRLPAACCTRDPMRSAVRVWRRGGAYRKARRLLREVKAWRRRVILPGEEHREPRLFGIQIRINPLLGPDEFYMGDGRRIVAGRRAFSEEARHHPVVEGGRRP